MQKYFIKSSSLSGSIKTPPSKSETMRSLLFAALGRGKSVVRNYLASPDTTHMANACRSFGASVTFTTATQVEIIGVAGNIKSLPPLIFAGNSGLILRFSSAVAALGSDAVTLTGDASLQMRPMKELIYSLVQLGAKVVTKNRSGFAPLTIQGPIKPGKIKISGEDSQPVSALLIASSLVKGPVEIEVDNAGEKPWVALTLSWFDRLNIPYQNKNFSNYRTFGPSSFNGFSYEIPGDISTAAFAIGAALITN